MVFCSRSHLTTSLLTASLLVGCGAPAKPYDWGDYDVLTRDAPPPELKLGDVTLEPRDYEKFLVWGERWFRGITFGNERVVTDVIGIMNGSVQVPCAPPAEAGCRSEQRVLPILFAAIDELDGVQGNLFAGNGGPIGPGFTGDLVL